MDIRDLIEDSSSRQSQSPFGVPYFITFQPATFFSSFSSLSAAFNHGANDSVHHKWHDVSLSFLLNLPKIMSLAMSHIIGGGILSHSKRRDNASWVSLFNFIWKEHNQPKSGAKICAHPLPCLDPVLANNVSLYTYAVMSCTIIDDHLS